MPTAGPEIGPNAWAPPGEPLTEPSGRHSFRPRPTRIAGPVADSSVAAAACAARTGFMIGPPGGQPMMRMIKVSLVAAAAGWLAAHPAAWTQAAAPAQTSMAPVNALPNHRRVGEAASRPAVGIDQLGRDRQGRQQFVGCRAMRGELVLERAGRQD